MKAPNIPDDEALRLRSLKSLALLDTLPEERFDRLTRIAQRLFDVPIALVSLVDENRQWFKSCRGIDIRETSRDISFCGHAILGDEMLVIPDTLKDERFADNPLVIEEPKIRFYAGHPLTLPGLGRMGTLCIIDRKPRKLSASDLDAFKDLAAMAEREFAAIQLATQDELTEISNRRGFVVLAKQSLRLCSRNHTSATLVFLDLNHFKSINDELGHAEGDHALLVFASEMKNSFRSSDIFARMGGDEFVVLCINQTKEHAKDAITRFRRKLNAVNKKENKGYEISFSYGVVEFEPDKHQTINDLIEEGDRLMYRFKKREENKTNKKISSHR